MALPSIKVVRFLRPGVAIHFFISVGRFPTRRCLLLPLFAVVFSGPLRRGKLPSVSGALSKVVVALELLRPRGMPGSVLFALLKVVARIGLLRLGGTGHPVFVAPCKVIVRFGRSRPRGAPFYVSIAPSNVAASPPTPICLIGAPFSVVGSLVVGPPGFCLWVGFAVLAILWGKLVFHQTMELV